MKSDRIRNFLFNLRTEISKEKYSIFYYYFKNTFEICNNFGSFNVTNNEVIH